MQEHQPPHTDHRLRYSTPWGNTRNGLQQPATAPQTDSPTPTPDVTKCCACQQERTQLTLPCACHETRSRVATRTSAATTSTIGTASARTSAAATPATAATTGTTAATTRTHLSLPSYPLQLPLPACPVALSFTATYSCLSHGTTVASPLQVYSYAFLSPTATVTYPLQLPIPPFPVEVRFR